MGCCMSSSAKSDSPASPPKGASMSQSASIDSSALSHMLCDACKDGLFRHDNFRQAIEKLGGESADVEGADEDVDDADEDVEVANEDVEDAIEDAYVEDADEDVEDAGEDIEDAEEDAEEDVEDANEDVKDADAEHEYAYTTTWGAVSRSATGDGCHWCKLLMSTRDSLPDASFPRGGANEAINIRVHIRISAPVDWTDVENVLEIYINATKAAVYYIYANHDDEMVSKEIGLGAYCRETPSYVDYDEAKKCLDNCSRNHPTCPSSADTTLPTRLIDCSEPQSPRLYETHRKMQGRYVTLSYVWGGDQKQKTTRANLPTYVHDGFKLKDLPKTIADAIVATNKLDLRWLWVDALCIIQDSDEDKLQELADMAHIYQDSYVTLSILSSFRADHGFLPDEGEHPVLPFICEDGTVGSMKLRYYIQRPGHVSRRHQTVTMYSPLDTRTRELDRACLGKNPMRRVF
ncbi:HET-domain-containing protein [Agrocybe pediades]|nr:HET-domain-containing protein [Agrocybe pediades]